MNKRKRLLIVADNQHGQANGLLLSLILSVVLLVGALSFGFWAFAGRQSYKNDVDSKIAAAVTVAKQQESTVKDAEFAQAAKQPLRTYAGPQAYGSIVVQYPKTWSGYVDDSGNGSSLVDGYFYPNIVPSIASQASVFALRVQVVAQAYSDVLNSYNDQESTGKLTATAYALPKVPKVVGVELNGALTDQQNGVMVILPDRDKTLEVYTEGSQFVDDFNKNILPNLTFSP